MYFRGKVNFCHSFLCRIYAIKKQPNCVGNWVAECQPVRGRVMHPLNMSQNKMSQFLKDNNALLHHNKIWIIKGLLPTICLTQKYTKKREINVLSYWRDSEHYYTRICSTSSFLVVDGVYALLFSYFSCSIRVHESLSKLISATQKAQEKM